MRSTWTVALGFSWLAVSCASAPVPAPLRALQSSGPVAFVCLGAPDQPLADAARPLSACTNQRVDTSDDYSIPHLYALVTQPATGEVAVVDLTTRTDAVLDQDPGSPGANFLPVGAIPTDIVSTPGSVATFVASAEPGFEAIYALPSDQLRGGPARLTSWPVCALPATPGALAVIVDPASGSGEIRPRCDTAYGSDELDEGCEGESHCHGDLSVDASSVGSPGRYKLAVSLPDEGGIALIDAQDILDQEAGAYGPCPIDRWLPLEVELPPAAPSPPPPEDAACVPHAADGDPFAQSFIPRPAGLAVDGDRLYVADEGSPAIHRLGLSDPCQPVELPPLVATSAEDPDEVVTTSRVAVSPKTLDFAQYLYAIDHLDGSIMVFDVTEGATSRYPLSRPNPELNPFQPPDRVRLGSPARDIVVAQLQNDVVDSETGSTIPVRCDPEPGAEGPGTRYRTSASYDAGASPGKLRGVFAFAVLQSGDISVIDVDDYDAPCRGPSDEHPLLGCAPPWSTDLSTSDEFSCRTVSPHEQRAGAFLLTREGIANNEPGINSLPVLFDADGSVLQLDGETDAVPRMRATVPEPDENIPADVAAYDLRLVVGSGTEQLDDDSGLLRAGNIIDATEHTLAMNLADPRAHILSQDWSVTYEGAIPGFSNRFAELRETGPGVFELRETTSAFCSRGVRPEQAIAETLEAEGVSPAQAAATARRLADYVQVISDSPVEADPYWASQDVCTFNGCQQRYGTSDAPLVGRDLRIVEATEDTLTLVPRGSTAADDLKCCFPGVMEFRVRGGNQWMVVGNQVGFLHGMTVSDEGTCRPSCDPSVALLDGRVREIEIDPGAFDLGDGISDEHPLAFQNPFFRFAITSPDSERGMRFRFTTQNAFSPLTLTIVTDNPNVQPTSANFLAPTGELVVSDGSLEGIVLLDLGALVITRQYQ